MNTEELNKLKYPIGEFLMPDHISESLIKIWINDIAEFPKNLIKLTKNLTDKELEYKYRPDGWTIREVVHHCADSHINSILRFKLTLTEDTPTIKPYFEDRFARLIDYTEPIEPSLQILNGIHAKLGVILSNLKPEELSKSFMHPEHGKTFSILETIGTYAWHSKHHTAHVKQALEFKDKF